MPYEKELKKIIRPSICFSIVGTWESVNLNPTVIIYRNEKTIFYYICIETTQQASLLHLRYKKMVASIFIATASKRLYIDYNPEQKMALAFHHWVTICVTN